MALLPDALWFRTSENRDRSNGPLAHPFARSLTPLTNLLALHCSNRLRAPLRSFVRSLTHFRAHHVLLHVNLESKQSAIYFSTTKLQIFARGGGAVHNPPDTLVWNEAENWGVGSNIVTTLYSDKQEVRSSKAHPRLFYLSLYTYLSRFHNYLSVFFSGSRSVRPSFPPPVPPCVLLTALLSILPYLSPSVFPFLIPSVVPSVLPSVLP